MITHRATPVGLKYYQVIGRDKHIPKIYYTRATDVATAKIHFYYEAGTDVKQVLRITKKQFQENTK
jgi:hypothetical protein